MQPAPAGWGPPSEPRAAWHAGGGGYFTAGGRPVTARPRSYFNRYLVWSIIATVFFSIPFGAAGIVLSAVALRRDGSGDAAGALRSIRWAKYCCWVATVIGVVTFVLVATHTIKVPTL